MNNDNIMQKLMHLLQDNLSDEKGKDLIKLLNEIYVDIPSFNQDIAVMSYRVAQSDLIKTFNQLLKMNDEDFKEPELNHLDDL